MVGHGREDEKYVCVKLKVFVRECNSSMERVYWAFLRCLVEVVGLYLSYNHVISVLNGWDGGLR